MGSLRRHDGLEDTRYRMREKLLAIGDEFWDRGRGLLSGVQYGGALATVAGTLSRMDSR
jgi:hypothetical protein